MDRKQPAPKVSIEQLQSVMDRILLPTPRPWLAAIGVAAALSIFEVTRTAAGALIVTARLTTTTVILVALFWLPFLLKVLALTGGGLKTVAGEG